MGHFEEQLADGRIRRGETYTCCHCNGHVEFKDNMGLNRPPAMCGVEKKPVCPRCHARGNCVPLERKLERIEARARLFEAMREK